MTGNFLTMFFFFFLLTDPRFPSSIPRGAWTLEFFWNNSSGESVVVLRRCAGFSWHSSHFTEKSGAEQSWKTQPPRLGETSKSCMSGQAWSTLLYCSNGLRHCSNTSLLLLKHIYCLRLRIITKQIQMKISQDHKRLLKFKCKTTSMTKPWICLYLHPQARKRHGWRNQIRKWAQFWLWKTAGAVQAAAWWRRGSCHSFAVFVMHPP